MVDRHGLDTPEKLARCSHRDLVRLLGQAGYARYDESTAKRLHALSVRAASELDVQLISLKKNELDTFAFQAWLLSFEGVGPKTLEIFMRETAALLEHRSTAGSSR